MARETNSYRQDTTLRVRPGVWACWVASPPDPLSIRMERESTCYSDRVSTVSTNEIAEFMKAYSLLCKAEILLEDRRSPRNFCSFGNSHISCCVFVDSTR